MKKLKFDVTILYIFLLLGVAVAILTFVIGVTCFGLGLNHYYTQNTVYGTYTDFNMTSSVEQYYEYIIWPTAAAFAGVLTLYVFIAFLLLGVILFIIDAFVNAY